MSSSLLRKSAYGLSKAPRLWYVRAKELLEELNFIELELCHVTFVLEEGKQVTAIVCLHVGDGFLTTSTTRMKDLHNMISSKFNIKEWQHIGEGMSPFLGVNTRRTGNTFVDDMSEYVSKIQPRQGEHQARR